MKDGELTSLSTFLVFTDYLALKQLNFNQQFHLQVTVQH